MTWAPSFRVHDSTTVEADPEVLAIVKRYEGALSKELDVDIGTTATELDSRTATVRSQEAAIGDLIADAIKDRPAATSPSPTAAASAPTRSMPRARSCRAATSFPNCRSATRPPSSRSPAPRSRRRLRTASRSTSRRPAASRRSRASSSTSTRSSRSARASRTSWRTASPSTRRRSTRSRPTTSCSRAATATSPSPRAEFLIGLTDGKLLANEVMVYVRRKGTVDAKVEGRIVIR